MVDVARSAGQLEVDRLAAQWQADLASWAIPDEILSRAPGAREIADRGAAIRAANAELQAGDALVIAGKGHETGQIVGQTKLPFSDMEAAREALAQNA